MHHLPPQNSAASAAASLKLQHVGPPRRKLQENSAASAAASLKLDRWRDQGHGARAKFRGICRGLIEAPSASCSSNSAQAKFRGICRGLIEACALIIGMTAYS